MPRVRPALILATVVLLPIGARADAFRTPPLKQGGAVPVQAYGRQNPDCVEWTDGCVVCAVAAARTQCSTPGIACTPAGLTCKRRSKP